MRAAHESGMERAGKFDVVDESPLAGEQRRIFLARNARAEPFRSHETSGVIDWITRPRAPASFAADASRDELSAEVNAIRDIRDISNAGEAAHRTRPRRHPEFN
jgi:hypothetical protein